MARIVITRPNGETEYAELTTDKSLVGNDRLAVEKAGTVYYAKLASGVDTHLYVIKPDGRKFYVQKKVIEYTVPEGTASISKEMVKQYNLNRAGELVFPHSVKQVKRYAFLKCTLLTNVSIPECTFVGDYAFKDCASLTNISLPACTRVSDHAFFGCTSLTNISLSACTSISNDAFSECTSLTNISLPACTSISGSVFNGCTSLTNVSIPECTFVGDYAFYMCDKLQTLILSDSWEPTKDAQIPTTATIYNKDKTKKVDWNTMSWVYV